MYTPETVQAVARAMQTDDATHYAADAAHMLEDYAATLKAAQGGVTDAMAERDGVLAALRSLKCPHDGRNGDVYEKAAAHVWGDAIITAMRTVQQLTAPPAQPAEAHFPDANALADWLESLHECHTDGAVGNRKWEAAQIAAKAVRGPAQPAERVPEGYALTLVRDGLIRVAETNGTKQSPGQATLIDRDRYPVQYGFLSAMLASQQAAR